jgi:hypothetical protein
VTRNAAVVIFRIVSAILNAAEALINCGTLGGSELLGVVLDLVKDCTVSEFVSWVEVDAETDCVGNVNGLPNLVSCVAGLVPCTGDVFSAINNGNGVAQAIENTVNGVCTVIQSRQGLHAACDEGCPECSELDVDLACGFGSFSACFDPLNSLPTVSCVDVDSPECDDFGVPVITRIDGSTIIPGGGSVVNHVYFTDENAGINLFASTPISDTCGGCASPGAFDPGVSLFTSGSFQFFWSCTCGTLGQDFQATYQHRLYDSQGNVSPPYTQQVGCSCVSSGSGVASESGDEGAAGIRPSLQVEPAGRIR